jgi:methylsterol monooxygenase
MHLGPLYARFHRLHHDFIYTHVSANHAFHDIELFLYGLSVGIPPLLINAHIFTHWAHTAFTIVHTAAQHSGYDLLFSSASSFHDGHHIFVGKNFSAHLPVMDVIFGTYIRNAEPERKSARNRSYQTRMPEPGAFAWWANALVLPSNLRIGKAGTIERE